MTTFHLHGGSITPQLKDGTVNTLFKNGGTSRILAFVDHSTKDRNVSMNLLQSSLHFSIIPYDLNMDLNEFDGVYIAGGNEQSLLSLIHKGGTKKLISLISRSKVYVGSSAGAQILGKYYFAWGTFQDNPYAQGIFDNGLGFFPDTLIEVHYSQYDFKSRLHHTFDLDPHINHAFGIDEGSIISIPGLDPYGAKLTLGTAEILHKSKA